MASKSKTKNRKKPAGNQLLAQAQRNLEKGNYRRALKDAKVCYRQAQTDEHRRLLEFAYIGRAQELQRHGDREACRGVTGDLLELAVTEPAVEAALPELLLWLGMLDRLPAGAAGGGEPDAAWQRKVADQAVLHPDTDLRSWPEIREGAGRVRRALQALCQGDAAEADVDLPGIARTGPLADWKLFLRGLAAFYEQDFNRMRNNWSRLDQDRAAARIARPLLALADDSKKARLHPKLRARLQKVEHAVSGSLLTRLAALQRHFDRGQLTKALSSARSICQDLRRLDPALEQRLIRVLHDRIVLKGQARQLDSLVKAAGPLPLDPQWNRARALLLEFCEHADRQAPLPHWRAYIRDLDSVTALPPAQRDLAKAIVWHHVAKDYAIDARPVRGWLMDEDDLADEDELAEEALVEAEKCLSHCFELAPGYAPAYVELARLYEALERPAQAADAYRRLLQHQPDHFDALLHLTEFHLQGDEPLDAQRYAQRARRLKPLDRPLARLTWAAHLESARHCALRGEFDRGRDEFAAADALLPQRKSADPRTLAGKAVLESKAGAGQATQKLIDQALQELDSPAPFWLAMAIESARYELPKVVQSDWEKQWRDVLKRRCSSYAAGEMSRLAIALQTSHGSYRMPSAYEDQIVAYLKRCSRVKWHGDDLKQACELLLHQNELDLASKFFRKALKLFPQDAAFQFMGAQAEFFRGPRQANFYVVQARLQNVLNLTQDSSDGEDQALAARAQKLLQIIDISVFGSDHWLGDDYDD